LRPRRERGLLGAHAEPRDGRNGRAAAGVAVQTIAGIPAREAEISCDAASVRLWLAADLESCLDRHALLCDSDAPEPPYWMHLWPAAATLARLVAGSERIGPGARVVELGCGLGLPALLAAQRGAFAVATDWKREPLLFAQASAKLNGCHVEVLQMDWTALPLRRDFDFCFGADVGYDARAESALVHAVAALLRPAGTAWLADSVNVHRSGLSEELNAAGFEISVSWQKEQDEGRPVWVRLIEAVAPGGARAR
jgi:ETFB lysine methyltransferase